MIGWRLVWVQYGRCDLCTAWLESVRAWRHWTAAACFDFTACQGCADKLIEEDAA